MRTAFLYYLIQAWTAERHRPTRRQAPARALATAVTTEGETRHATQRVGGGVYNINVNVPPSVNKPQAGREIVQCIREFERGSGKSWRTLT